MFCMLLLSRQYETFYHMYFFFFFFFEVEMRLELIMEIQKLISYKWRTGGITFFFGIHSFVNSCVKSALFLTNKRSTMTSVVHYLTMYICRLRSHQLLSKVPNYCSLLRYLNPLLLNIFLKTTSITFRPH